VQAAAFYPLNVGIASVSGIGGFLAGASAARSIIQGIEKKGEYRQSRKRILLWFGLGLGAVSVILAILFYLIVSETVPLNILTQFYSVYTALPALYLGGVVTFRSWELKKGKEIHWEGAWIGTFYAIPKGLTWQEQYTYRDQQRERMRAGNPPEPTAPNNPPSK